MPLFAVQMLSGPSFTPSATAPLAGVLRLSTDVSARVTVSVSDGLNTWTRGFYDFSETHAITLAGFGPNRTNQISVTVFDKAQNAYSAPQALTFVTPPLPSDFPARTVLHSEPNRMEPGVNLFIIQNRSTQTGFITFMDNSGQVLWYSRTATNHVYDVRQLSNGNLFIVEDPPFNRFIEMDLLGNTVNTWSPPAAYPINDHDGVPTDHGTILYLSDVSRTVQNFPGSATDPSAPTTTATVDDNPVVEISASTGQLLSAWSLLPMSNPVRVTYLTYQFSTPFGIDNYHANAVVEDPRDHSIIVSIRDQHAVVKFERPGGQVKWILGPHLNWGPNFQPYLLTPVGTPFQWNYGQHAPRITAQGTLMLYDNGNARACPFDPPVADQNNYSRAAEFSIDETNMQVSQVWESTPVAADRLYTGAVGSAVRLNKTGNVLITHGLVSYVNGARPSSIATNATTVRIREMTHDPIPQLVFELEFFDRGNSSPSYLGNICYRTARVPDLYAHPAQPVADLMLVNSGGATPRLIFNADPACNYVVQGSADLSNWIELGTAATAGAPGSFQFDDTSSGNTSGRFYRVMTQ